MEGDVEIEGQLHNKENVVIFEQEGKTEYLGEPVVCTQPDV